MNDTHNVARQSAMYQCEDCGEERIIDSPADRPTESKRAKKCRNCNDFRWFVIEGISDE